MTKKLKWLTEEESKAFKKAYALGRSSCNERIPFSHNPYKQKTIAYEGWSIGWKVASITIGE